MVPLKLGGSSGGIDFVVSFGCGVAIVTSAMWLIFILGLRAQRRPIPSLQLQVMWLPGSIAGIVWSMGNFCSTGATILLGEAIGYSSCQGAAQPQASFLSCELRVFSHTAQHLSLIHI